MKPLVISHEVALKLVPKSNLAVAVYDRIKNDIFDFRLLPGERFTETEVAERVGVSRTPVREALYKLEREGYIQVSSRNGWSVKPFDFEAFEDLYDVRVILELAATRKLCEREGKPELDELKETWLVPPEKRIRDPQMVCELDERFHASLVAAAGNPQLARIHHEITEQIRIIRRLDFTQPDRIDSTYDEHAQILRNVLRRRLDQSNLLLRSHIESSKASVRKITLHRLHTARATLAVQPRRRTRAA
ncbi:MAG: GntR family transcriptional regulator [Burkholderiales bacterium]